MLPSRRGMRPCLSMYPHLCESKCNHAGQTNNTYAHWDCLVQAACKDNCKPVTQQNASRMEKLCRYTISPQSRPDGKSRWQRRELIRIRTPNWKFKRSRNRSTRHVQTIESPKQTKIRRLCNVWTPHKNLQLPVDLTCTWTYCCETMLTWSTPRSEHSTDLEQTWASDLDVRLNSDLNFHFQGHWADNNANKGKGKDVQKDSQKVSHNPTTYLRCDLAPGNATTRTLMVNTKPTPSTPCLLHSPLHTPRRLQDGSAASAARPYQYYKKRLKKH